MKILALDLGDDWTGTAISDAMNLIATPYKTIATNFLEDFLEKTILQEKIERIIVGYPKTMKGTLSDQTRKVVAHKELLEKKFPQVSWELFDERLSSKMASGMKKTKNKEEKQKLHSIAAAIILETYLEYLRNIA